MQQPPTPAETEATQALAALDAAGFGYTVVCAGTQPGCPGWGASVAA